MKKKFLLLSLLTLAITAQGQTNKPSENITITSQKEKTEVSINSKGELTLNVSPKDSRKFKKIGAVHYSDFGAKGDGKTDDIDVIAATHAFANQEKLPVKADDKATYYIGGKTRPVIIQTDTDFGSASFIIDDREVQNRNAPVFMVSSNLQSFPLQGIATLKRNQEKINVSLPDSCLISVTNSNVKHYIRFGLNQNNGSSQTDIFMVDKNGNVDMNSPIIWDFDQITKITALPIDKKILHIKGGHFTTIANVAESKYTYYNRNFAIRRSNVIVDGMEHYITGEGDHGAPYLGFINIGECSYVTVKNTTLTGHKTYSTIGSAEKPVAMGTYDLCANRALNISFISCKQSNDINDKKYWGILASNYCKNILYDGCTLSRFDAHQGVANATIRNSTLGHAGINAIGSGTLTVEKCTLNQNNLINLRSDYGSTWQGEIIIRDCVFITPADQKDSSPALINGNNSGEHDFGYTCYMPEKVTIENLRIDDSNRPDNYQGPIIFDDFNPKMTSDAYRENFPYVKTKEVILKNITTTSGKALRVSNNSFMFKDVKVEGLTTVR